MSERLELIDEYMKAKVAFDKASSWLDAVKFQLKQMGTFREGDVNVDVSVVSRETLSIKDLERFDAGLVDTLRNLGVIKVSESERLSVKIKEQKND